MSAAKPKKVTGPLIVPGAGRLKMQAVSKPIIPGSELGVVSVTRLALTAARQSKDAMQAKRRQESREVLIARSSRRLLDSMFDEAEKRAGACGDLMLHAMLEIETAALAEASARIDARIKRIAAKIAGADSGAEETKAHDQSGAAP